MLQKVDKDRLDKVLATIESAKIKFPNVTLTRELGVDGGTVSAYLNGKKPMSSNFFGKFMDKYGSTKATHATSDSTLERLINNNTDLIGAHVSVAKATEELAIANKELSEANKELTIMLKNSVNLNGQNNSHPVLVSVVQRIAERGVPMLWASVEQGTSILNSFLSNSPLENSEVNKMNNADKGGIS